MGLDDGAIDAACESEIIGVEDEPSHAESLAGKRDRAAVMLYDVDSFHGFDARGGG
jgi:hypothetical protein